MATVQTATDQRVVLHNIDWETYLRLLESHSDSSAPRFTYDRGELEIMSPLPKHERYARAFEAIADALATERGMELDTSYRSTTFRREDLQQGFEADACLYVQNAPRVRGKDRIDLSIDPPPDVVVEIDITHPSVSKLPIFASFGVPEVWRYDDESFRICVLEGGRYISRPDSLTLPVVTASEVTRLLEECKLLDWASWLRLVREWARGLPSP